MAVKYLKNLLLKLLRDDCLESVAVQRAQARVLKLPIAESNKQ